MNKKQAAKTVGLIATVGFSGLLAYALYKKIKSGLDFNFEMNFEEPKWPKKDIDWDNFC